MAHGAPAPGSGAGGAVDEGGYHTGKVVRLAAVAALGGFLFGFDSAVINGAVGAIEDKFNISAGFIGFVVAIALIGSAIGAWYAGSLANRFGRRRVMLVAAAMFLVAAVGQAFPFAVADLMMWRFIGGAGIGIASVIAPMYIAEIAPAHLRGRLGSMQQLAIVVGIFTSALTNTIILELAERSAAKVASPAARTEWLLGLEAWQWMFLVMLVPAVVYGVAALRIPESPRYLVSVGREEEAGRVLSSVFSGDVDQMIVDIRESVHTDSPPSYRDLRGPVFGLQKIVWIGILLSAFQQFVGINVIFYYSNIIWSAVGFDESDAFTITLITNTTNVVVTLVAISLVDRVGRRPLLLVGSLGMFASLLTLAVVFGTAPVSNGEPQLEGAAGTIAVVAANMFVVFFGATWGPVVWVLLGEIFPNRIRAAALAVAAAAQWIANFIVSMSFPELATFSLGLAYGIFTVMALLSFFFVLRFVKETKGKTLEELSEEETAAA